MKNIKKISEFKSKLKEEEILAECLVFIDNEQFDKAVDCFNGVLKEYPDNLNALFGKALSLDECNEWGKAIQVLNHGLNIEPNNVHGLIIKAEIMTKHGKLELALKCYDALIKISPSDKYYYLSKAEILEDLGRTDEALHCYETGIKMSPESKIEQDELAPEPIIEEPVEPEPIPEAVEEPSAIPIIEEPPEPIPEAVEEPATIPIIEEPPEPMPELVEEPDLEHLIEELENEPEQQTAEPETIDEPAPELIIEESVEPIPEIVDEPEPEQFVEEHEPESVPMPEEDIEDGKKVMIYRGFEVKGVLDDTGEVSQDYPEDDWKTGPDRKPTRRHSSISLIGIFSIMTIAIYMMFISGGVIYDCFIIEMDFNILWPNTLLFILGLGALYGGIYVAKNSILFDHFMDSMFENEIYPRLEPALEEVAEVQARLEDIDERIDRVNLNFVRYKRHPPIEEFPALSIDSKITMFLKFIVTINITIGVLLYILNFSGSYAPYAFTMLFMLWWVVITEEYKLWKVATSWSWAILPIFTVPVISILLWPILHVGMLIGLIGLFLTLYAYGYFTWARYYVEGSLPFGLHEAEINTDNSEEGQ